jgi:hypothetical protein
MTLAKLLRGISVAGFNGTERRVSGIAYGRLISAPSTPHQLLDAILQQGTDVQITSTMM